MSDPVTAIAFLTWWREELVRALLWGVWRFVVARKDAQQDAAFGRFCRLVDAAPCFPCRIEYEHPGRMRPDRHGAFRAPLCILAGRAAEDADLWDQEDWG